MPLPQGLLCSKQEWERKAGSVENGPRIRAEEHPARNRLVRFTLLDRTYNRSENGVVGWISRKQTLATLRFRPRLLDAFEGGDENVAIVTHGLRNGSNVALQMGSEVRMGATRPFYSLPRRRVTIVPEKDQYRCRRPWTPKRDPIYLDRAVHSPRRRPEPAYATALEMLDDEGRRSLSFVIGFAR